MHAWGIIEQNSGAILHAARYLLDKIDACESSFLKQIGLDDASAFLNFNFAPPSLRRDIGILGMFHKRVLGLAHPIIEKLFFFLRHCCYKINDTPLIFEMRYFPFIEMRCMGHQQEIIRDSCMVISLMRIINYTCITVPFFLWFTCIIAFLSGL